MSNRWHALDQRRPTMDVAEWAPTQHVHSQTAIGGTGKAGCRCPPDGWVARGFVFEVAWPADPEAVARIHPHLGARRFACNWALARVKADLDAKKLDPAHESVPWNLDALRKQFNVEKHAVAPWWRESSKEAYATGIADLCVALKNWSESRSGRRSGRKVGFPGFRSKRKDQARVRFTTGPVRTEPDRRTITLPVVGPLHSLESTRRLERLVATGTARILTATLSERLGAAVRLVLLSRRGTPLPGADHGRPGRCRSGAPGARHRRRRRRHHHPRPQPRPPAGDAHRAPPGGTTALSMHPRLERPSNPSTSPP